MPGYIAELRALVGSRPLILCAAGVLLLDDQSRVLLHHRTDDDTWDIPGGALELGERLEEAARREVYEEVRLTCHSLTLFGIYSGPEMYHRYPNGHEVHLVCIVYLCRDFSGTVYTDGQESTEAAFFPLDDLPAGISPPNRVLLEDLRARWAAGELA